MTTRGHRSPAPDYFDSVNHTLPEQVEPSAQRFLELGCGAGAFAKAVRSRQWVARYLGVDRSSDALMLAANALDLALHRDLDAVQHWDSDGEMNQALIVPGFDHVILGDVPVHLYAPSSVLSQAVRYPRIGGSALICMSNVHHWSASAQLIAGQWPQLDSGLFDRTHIRWYTLRDMVSLTQECCLVVEKIIPRVFSPEAAEPVLKALEPAVRLVGPSPEQFRKLALPLQYVLVGRKTFEYTAG